MGVLLLLLLLLRLLRGVRRGWGPAAAQTRRRMPTTKETSRTRQRVHPRPLCTRAAGAAGW